MKKVVLLRGVTPVGKNKIPKMAYLVASLSAANFHNVTSYRQSGNLILSSHLSDEEIAAEVHRVIREKIGADLAVIVKSPEQLRIALAENPFDSSYDSDRVLVVLTNSRLSPEKIKKLQATRFSGEEFAVGSQCFYLYVPRDAPQKKLSTTYLEKQLAIVATSRKLKVIQQLLAR